MKVQMRVMTIPSIDIKKKQARSGPGIGYLTEAPMSDQDIISTCNINATSRRIINENLEVKGWIVWSFIRFYHGTKKPLSKGDERVSFPFRGPCKKNS